MLTLSGGVNALVGPISHSRPRDRQIFWPDLERMTSAPKIRVSSEGYDCSMAPAAKSPSNAPASYEAALEELEQLLARLESGDLPLAQLLTQYQRGATLLKYCRDQLEAVEGQIKVLDQGALKTWTPE